MSALDYARQYRERGMYPIPIPHGQKVPTMEGWQNLRLDVEDLDKYFNGEPQNIGIQLSSSGIVDVDLDTEDACLIAPAFLPPTLTMGRESAPRSHWIYRTAERRQTKKYQLGRETLVERRDQSSKGTPHQTVFPPSVHPSGEAYRFYDEREIAEMDADELVERVALLAAAVVFARHWPRGGGVRHDAALATASVLLRAGISDKLTETFIGAVAQAAGDDELDDRIAAVSSTADALALGQRVTGMPRLLDLLGEDPKARKALQKAADWLGFTGSQEPTVFTPPLAGASVGEGGAIRSVKFKNSDLGNAERFAHYHGHNVRFCFPWNSWLAWDQMRYQRDASGEVQRQAYAMVRKMGADAVRIEDDAERVAAMKWATSSESHTRQRALVAMSQPLLPVQPDDLDADPWLFNVRNGTLDLRTGKLKPHDRADLITKLANVEFEPGARCPRWLRFLSEVFAGDQQLVDYVQRALAYSLTGSTREQAIFIAYGHGANGKGTLLNTVQQLAGDYAQAMRPDLLMVKRATGGASEGEASLHGSRFVVTSETGSGQRFDEALVKRLTGSDRIRARFLHANEFEFDPTHSIWLATNHKPTIEGTDLAIWRRVHLIPFAVSFRGEAADKALPEKLEAELSGILNWLVEGCLAWQRGGLQPPAAVMDATSEYQSEMDVLGGFIEECCDLSIAEMTTPANRLYKAYTAWCERTGESAQKRTKFGLLLAERGFNKKRTGKGYLYLGVHLNEDDRA